jgi:hypothetical protein
MEVKYKKFVNPHQWGTKEYFDFRVKMYESLWGLRSQVYFYKDGVTKFRIL